MNDAPMLRAVWAAMSVLLVLGAIAWWARRKGLTLGGLTWGRAGTAIPLCRLARLPLGPQHALHIVEWEGQRWLVGTGPQGFAVHSILASGRFASELESLLSGKASAQGGEPR